MKNYTPSQKVLEEYAKVLVNFALNSGQGIKRGETVYLITFESAKPLYIEICKAIWKAGGNVISDYRPGNDDYYRMEHDFYIHADDEQITFFPAKYLRGLVEQADHMIFIDSQTDKQALAGIDPKKIMQRGIALKPYMDWRRDKENQGKFTWTIGLYGTAAMAREVKLSEREYWNQIIKACYLDKPNPVREWQKVFKQLETYRKRLNKLLIDHVHIEGPEVDLWVKIGDKRRWAGGSGRNIPSFELFTSPDWRGTNGWIKFNQPLYRYGNLIEGIELEFKNGRVVKSKARKNERILKEMIASPNADKIGEFSMTDKRFSRISKFMAETLYDENVGGPHGNCHIALGNAYHDCYAGAPSKITAKGWQKLGFNNSSVHTDIITTAPRTITAYLKNGKEKVIYQNGQYQF